MQEKANPRSDRGVQRAVLALVLEAHPESQTMADLASEFEHDEAANAVSELVRVGLLERSGIDVRLSPAMAHFQRLDLP